LAEVHHFALGWIDPLLAYVMSALGCLLGLMLMTKARARTGRRRVRLLIYAAVAIGGTGIWQMHFIAMLGFDVPAASLRYDALLTAASLGIAVLVVGGGLFVAGYGSPSPRRTIGAGVLIGVGTSAMHYAGMAAVRVGGTVDYEPTRFMVSITIAMAVASAALWFTVALKGLRATLLAAAVMAAAISGMHYTGMSAVRVHLGTDYTGVAGIPPILLIGPIVLLGGAAIAMVAFFTFGNSTVQEVRAMYDDGMEESTGVIEVRILADVMTRVTTGTPVEPLVLPDGPYRAPAPARARTRQGSGSPLVALSPLAGGPPLAADPPAAGLPRAGGPPPADAATNGGGPMRPPGPRPTPGIKPIWRSMPVWGRPDDEAANASTLNHALTLAPSRYPPRPNPGQTAAPATPARDVRNSSWRNRRNRPV